MRECKPHSMSLGMTFHLGCVCVCVSCFFLRCVLGSLEGVFRLPRVLPFGSIRSPLHREGRVNSVSSRVNARTHARTHASGGAGTVSGDPQWGPLPSTPSVLGDTTPGGPPPWEPGRDAGRSVTLKTRSVNAPPLFTPANVGPLLPPVVKQATCFVCSFLFLRGVEFGLVFC